jgi:hypothetical protein
MTGQGIKDFYNKHKNKLKTAGITLAMLVSLAKAGHSIYNKFKGNDDFNSSSEPLLVAHPIEKDLDYNSLKNLSWNELNRKLNPVVELDPKFWEGWGKEKSKNMSGQGIKDFYNKHKNKLKTAGITLGVLASLSKAGHSIYNKFKGKNDDNDNFDKVKLTDAISKFDREDNYLLHNDRPHYEFEMDDDKPHYDFIDDDAEPKVYDLNEWLGSGKRRKIKEQLILKGPLNLIGI